MEEKIFEWKRLGIFGIAAVISGDFYGWQSLLGNGFIIAISSLLLCSCLFLLLSLCLGELYCKKELERKRVEDDVEEKKKDEDEDEEQIETVPCIVGAVFGDFMEYFVTGLELLKVTSVCSVVATGVASYLLGIVRKKK